MGLGSERGRLYSVLFLQSALQGLNCCAGVSASIGRGHAQHLPMLWFRTDEAPGFPYGDKVVHCRQIQAARSLQGAWLCHGCQYPGTPCRGP